MTRIDGNWAACNAHEAAECRAQEATERAEAYIDRYVLSLDRYAIIELGDQSTTAERLAVTERVSDLMPRATFRIAEDNFGGVVWRETRKPLDPADTETIEHSIQRLLDNPTVDLLETMLDWIEE